MKAYVFWYIMDAYGRTEYVRIIAVSEKQANFFWKRYLYQVLGRPYDYDLTPCNVMQCSYAHNVGDILGQNARV